MKAMETGSYTQLSAWKAQCEQQVNNGYGNSYATLSNSEVVAKGYFTLQNITQLQDAVNTFSRNADETGKEIAGLEPRLLRKYRIEVTEAQRHVQEGTKPDPTDFDHEQALSELVAKIPWMTMGQLLELLDETLGTPQAQMLAIDSKLNAFLDSAASGNSPDLNSPEGKSNFRFLLRNLFSRISITSDSTDKSSPVPDISREAQLETFEKVLRNWVTKTSTRVNSGKHQSRKDTCLRMSQEIDTQFTNLKLQATQKLCTLLEQWGETDWGQALKLLDEGANPFAYKGLKTRPNIMFKVIRDITLHSEYRGKPDPQLQQRTEFLRRCLSQPDAAEAMNRTAQDWYGNTPFTAAVAARDKEVSNIMLQYLSGTPGMGHLITTANANTHEHSFGHNTPLVLALKTNNESLAIKLLPHYTGNQLRETCTWAGNNALQLAHLGRFNQLLPVMARQLGGYSRAEARELQARYNSTRDDYRSSGDRFVSQLANWQDMYERGMYMDDEGRYVEDSRPAASDYSAENHIHPSCLETVSVTAPEKTSGFHNLSGNHCFANAALKQVIIGLKPSDIATMRNEAAQRLNAGNEPRASVITAFADLAEAVMAERAGEPSGADTAQLHQQLFTCIQAMGKQQADSEARQFAALFPDSGKRQGQQDSHEFLLALMSTLGLNDPAQQLFRCEITNSLEDHRIRKRMSHAELYYPLPVSKNQTLPMVMGHSREVMEGHNKVRWEEQVEVNGEQTTRTVLHRSEKLTWLGNDAPDQMQHLRIQAKLFDFDQRCFCNIRKPDEARDMVRDTMFMCLPIYNASTSQEERVPFEIRSIVMHIGDRGVTSGHYVTVENCNGRWIVHDDSKVTELKGGLEEFYQKNQGAAPYLIDLVR